jgi:hypothetical protein
VTRRTPSSPPQTRGFWGWEACHPQNSPPLQRNPHGIHPTSTLRRRSLVSRKLAETAASMGKRHSDLAEVRLVGRSSDHAKGSASLAPFTEPGSCPIGASNCPRRGRSLYGTARATARGISELPGLAAHRVGAADDGQLGRPDRFAACRADGPWPERWFREHYAHVFSLPPDEARQEMMRFFADPDQFEQIGLIPLGYNRAILLMAQAFHGTGETFGDSPETGRLSPHFEFYAA